PKKPAIDKPKISYDKKNTESFYKGKITNEFIYINPETLQPDFKKVIILKESLNKKGKKEKQTPWYYYDNEKYYIGLNGKKPYLYNLHKINEKTKFIIIAEGEKKTELIGKYLSSEYACLSYPTGANYRITDYDLKFFHSKGIEKVLLLPDYDFKKDGKYLGQLCSIENHLIIKQAGIDCHIVDFLDDALPDFSGYDIEDILTGYYGVIEYEREQFLENLFAECSEYQDNKFISKFGFIEKNNKRLFNTRFVNDRIKNIDHYSTLKAIQGAGKTTLMETRLDLNKTNIVISSREILSKELGKKFNINDYQEVSKRKNYTQSICSTINSISHFEGLLNTEIDTIVLDEISLLIDDLFRGKTRGLIGKDRLNSIGFLVTILKKAKNVLGLDADIRFSTRYFLKKFLGLNFTHYENLYKDDRKFIESKDFDSIVLITENELNNNEKVSLAITSEKKGEKLTKYYKDKFKDKKIIFISAYTKTREEQQAILKDHSLMLNYDLIIYTPTIFTGNDFNIPFSKKTFLICTDNRTVNHFQLMQSVGRFRQAKEVHYFIRLIEGTRKTKLKEIIKEKNIPLNEFMTLNPDYTFKEDKKLLLMYAILEKEDRESKNNLLHNFRNLIYSRGSNLTFQDKINSDLSGELSESFEKQNEDRINEILKAELIDINTASKYETEGTATEKEFYELEKFKYYNLAAGKEDIFKKIIPLDFDTIKNQCNRFSDMKESPETLKEQDLKNSSDYLPDNEYRSVKAKLRNEIEFIIGGISGGLIDNQKQEQVKEYIDANLDRIRYNLKLDVNSDKIGYFIRGFYLQLGLKLDLVKKSGKNRTYRINQESLYIMENLDRSGYINIENANVSKYYESVNV
ncbi:MAG: hypothetical protein KDK36_10720, partial [Leptospiraceae bacterium]|nr:hypothetical protein [Leptospiraceae bacterium]